MRDISGKLHEKSFLKAFWDGSLDSGIRLILTLGSLAAGSAFAGFFTIVFGLGRWDDEVMVVGFCISGVFLLGLNYFIWTRGIGHKPIVIGVMGSILLLTITICLCVFIDASLGGRAEEIWIFTTIFSSITVFFMLWAWVIWWGYKRMLVWDLGPEAEVFCIECGYNLRGRTDTKCPECGVEPTVEALLRGQGVVMAKVDKE
ncbi:hypothetical protein JD969_04865 [Planctomycetota bacterium]|nr:hypothetical protein JD969_04865 [Planctomycetota bacterium]